MSNKRMKNTGMISRGTVGSFTTFGSHYFVILMSSSPQPVPKSNSKCVLNDDFALLDSGLLVIGIGAWYHRLTFLVARWNNVL